MQTGCLYRSAQAGGASRTTEGVPPGQHRPTPWILGGPLVVTFDKADVRLTHSGLMVYGEDEKREIPLPDGREDGRDGIIQQVYSAVVEGRRPANDGNWGMATLEVLLALFQSGRERKEIFLSHQTATVD